MTVWVKTGSVPERQRVNFLVNAEKYPLLAQWIHSLPFQRASEHVRDALDLALRNGLIPFEGANVSHEASKPVTSKPKSVKPAVTGQPVVQVAEPHSEAVVAVLEPEHVEPPQARSTKALLPSPSVPESAEDGGGDKIVAAQQKHPGEIATSEVADISPEQLAAMNNLSRLFSV